MAFHILYIHVAACIYQVSQVVVATTCSQGNKLSTRHCGIHMAFLFKPKLMEQRDLDVINSETKPCETNQQACNQTSF